MSTFVVMRYLLHRCKGVNLECVIQALDIESTLNMLGVMAADNLELIKLDVKTTFLPGDLKEEIYMEQPKGFVAFGQEHLVCRLKKSLYGLK